MKKINKLLTLSDKLILYYFLFEILFLRWYGKSLFKYMHLIIITLIFFKVILRKVKFKVMDIIFCLIYIFVIVINILSNGIQPLLVTNGYMYGVVNIIPVIYIITLVYEKNKTLYKFLMKDLYRILNIYFVINIPILIKQLEGNYFLMRNTESNPGYFDHITGLIGASGTHELTFYWILLVLINLYKYYKTNNKRILIITGAYTLFMFIISSQNDNTAFFIIFPAIMMQYLLINIKNINISVWTIIKYIILIVVIGSLGVYTYKNNENVNEFVDTRVVSKLQQFGIGDRNNTNVDSDEERIALFKTALESGNGYKLGKGIGSIQSYGDPSLPQHFGMSEISIRTYEGGLIYLITLILFFSYFLNRITSNFSFMSFFIVVINMTFFAVYTQIFRKPFYTFALSIIVYIFNETYNNAKNVTKEE